MQIYGTVAGADAYALSIGNTAWGELTPEAKNSALVRGSLYVDSYSRRYLDGDFKCWLTFIGQKTGGWLQEREWPRTGIPGLPSNVIPAQIEYAAYEAAIREGTNPGSLNPDIDRTALVKREKVDVLEVTYAISDDANAGSLLPVFPAIDSLLSAFLVHRCRGGLAIYTV
jgi:hypothetical protein